MHRLAMCVELVLDLATCRSSLDREMKTLRSMPVGGLMTCSASEKIFSAT